MNKKNYSHMNRKVLMMILDGWGEGRHDHSNAIYTQGQPHIDAQRAKYPFSHLHACGEYVGLPDGQMGNSEVGHMNLGAGRVVYQDLVKINIACRKHALLENAEIKAEAIWAIAAAGGLHCYVLADDSGLSVDALNGEPGVYSHRWAGENATDADRILKMLRVMKEVPDEQRGAHCACNMCLIAPDGKKHHFEGRVEGAILREARGQNGFGYDPVFGYGGRSFAELSADEKNAVSHRHNALMQVLDFFRGAQ